MERLEMGWPDLLLFGGLIVGLVGAALSVRELKGRFWPTHEGPVPRSARYLEGIGVLVSQAMIFGGLAMLQFGSIATHISDNKRPADLGLSFAGAASAAFLLGASLGRLAMRWQVQRLLNELDTERLEASA
jgi:hypothetical protein